LPSAAAAALPGDREAASVALGAALSADWPQADLHDVLPLQAAAQPEAVRFGIWVMLERETNTVVGDVGFFGPPGSDGSVEIGFSVVPDRRGRGYATEAVREMVEWVRAQPGVSAVVARCEKGNEPSVRTLARTGFLRDGLAGAQVRWRHAVVGGS
jgi:RimJ/RimL family protein N-acetyltransferase